LSNIPIEIWVTVLKGQVLVVIAISGKIVLQYKEGTVQLIQDPNQSNVDNLNNVRREARRYFRQKNGMSES
jgi:hypothetical protein